MAAPPHPGRAGASRGCGGRPRRDKLETQNEDQVRAALGQVPSSRAPILLFQLGLPWTLPLSKQPSETPRTSIIPALLCVGVIDSAVKNLQLS